MYVKYQSASGKWQPSSSLLPSYTRSCPSSTSTNLNEWNEWMNEMNELYYSDATKRLDCDTDRHCVHLLGCHRHSHGCTTNFHGKFKSNGSAHLIFVSVMRHNRHVSYFKRNCRSLPQLSSLLCDFVWPWPRPWVIPHPCGHIGTHSGAIRVCQELRPLLPPRWTPSFLLTALLQFIRGRPWLTNYN